MSISCWSERHFATIYHLEADIFKTKLHTPINGDSNSADIQVECGDGSGPIKFMIQKAGATDNTLGFNGWQSADHWFTANLDPQSDIAVGELVWVNLEASIIKHLSFTNYRISTKRDGGKVCAGVLSGGVISDRPDGAKKSTVSLVAPTSLSANLPDLPEAFAKTQINVIQDRELPSESPKVVASEINKAISLPDLPTASQAPQKLDGHASVLKTNPQEKKKASPLLFAAIGLALLGLVIGGYFLTKGSPPAPINQSTSPQTTIAEEIKTSPGVSAMPPVAPSAVTPQPPKAPPANNAPRPSSNAPAGPDLNKIVKDAINK